ncbi:hypothetical protein BV20DRAFT_944246 [Pilatotrama ljubarskyi]|nr:hypothetical protein BV20DRAFT_944246 [Pilatotrama ljubarskyi]
MSTDCLVFFSVFYGSGAQFNFHEAACMILEHVCRSRYIGREKDLLIVRCSFTDLAERKTVHELRNIRQEIVNFVRTRKTQLVVAINTHADAMHGNLTFRPGHSAPLDAFIDHTCGDLVLTEFTNSMLFALCCGGLVKRALAQVREASKRFASVFAFGAPALDPILISAHFATTVLDFHVFGRESLWNTIQRAGKPEVLNHSDVYMAIRGDIFRMRSACLRRRPNGDLIRCCNQIPKYQCRIGSRIRYRCLQPAHRESRTFWVKMLPVEAHKRWIIGETGKDRYMIELV